MKKTIIALLALGGIASAGVGRVDLTDIEGLSYTSPIIATSELTLENLTTIISVANTNRALLGITMENGETDPSWSISVGSWSGSCQLHIYNTEAGNGISGNAAASFAYTAEGAAANLNLKDYFTTTGAVKGAITLGYAGDNATQVPAGTAVLLSVLYSDGTIKNLYGVSGAQKYSSCTPKAITYDDSLLNKPVVTTTVDWSEASLVQAHATLLKATSAVPEPTTATLSLLALAGLAARRRRK